jgi:hypothetical protein
MSATQLQELFPSEKRMKSAVVKVREDARAA